MALDYRMMSHGIAFDQVDAAAVVARYEALSHNTANSRPTLAKNSPLVLFS